MKAFNKISNKYLPFKKVYKLLPNLLLVKLNKKLGNFKYNITAENAPNNVSIAGANLINKGKANSASTIAILLGCKKILFPKKSEPTPTKASLVK
jgi:hypothetical protein